MRQRQEISPPSLQSAQQVASTLLVRNTQSSYVSVRIGVYCGGEQHTGEGGGNCVKAALKHETGIVRGGKLSCVLELSSWYYSAGFHTSVTHSEAMLDKQAASVVMMKMMTGGETEKKYLLCFWAECRGVLKQDIQQVLSI